MVLYTGLVAWYLLILNVIVGSMVTGGVAKITAKYTIKMWVHKITGWALVFVVGLHIGSIVYESFNGWGWWEVGPLDTAGPWSRMFGVIALYLLAVIIVLVIFRLWIPRKVWVFFHKTLPFLLLAFATVHGLIVGTIVFYVVGPGAAALTLLGAVFIVRNNVRWSFNMRHPRGVAIAGRPMRPLKIKRYRHRKKHQFFGHGKTAVATTEMTETTAPEAVTVATPIVPLQDPITAKTAITTIQDPMEIEGWVNDG
jgi:hypothetical protein